MVAINTNLKVPHPVLLWLASHVPAMKEKINLCKLQKSNCLHYIVRSMYIKYH